MNKREARVEVYVGEDGQYRWRLVAANYEIMPVGAEGFATQASAKRAVRRSAALLARAPIRLVV